MKEWADSFFISLCKEEVKRGERAQKKVGLLVLGDVFDDRKSLNLAVNDFAITMFAEVAEVLPTVIINGNHDLYRRTNVGVTSLKSLEFIPNVTVICTPTRINFPEGKVGIAIPYLGSATEETKCLVENADADYAFMHTDINKMKYANNQKVISGVNVDSFTGHIYAGHIHKRQQTKKVTYVGCPYQLNRSDIGNEKGVYILEVATGKAAFKENKVSPLFLQISFDEFSKMDDESLKKIFSHNYVDIIVDDTPNMATIYKKIQDLGAKKVSIIMRSNGKALTDTLDINIEKVSLKDVVSSLISSIDADERQMERIKSLNENYFTALNSIDSI